MGRVHDRWVREVDRYRDVPQAERNVRLDAAITIAAETVDPTTIGLERITDRKWVRLDSDRTLMFEFHTMKAGGVVLSWGLSLPYVPHKLRPRPAFHRTARAARLDLYDSSFPPRADLDHADIRKIHTFFGAECVRIEAAHLWTYVRPAALQLWNRTTTTADVLAEAEARLRDPYYPYRSVALVAAFAAAHLGDIARALDHLAAPHAYFDDQDRDAARALIQSSR